MSEKAGCYKDFLENCLGSSVEDTDAHDKSVLGIKGDIFAIEEDDKETKDSTDESEAKKKVETECFAMGGDSDSDSGFGSDDDDEWDLEDAYNFDPERVAELLKKGNYNEEELVETIQEGMAEAMLERMNLIDDPDLEATRPDCSGDVDGRMTPPPKGKDQDAATPPDPKVLASKLENVKEGRRRSSIGGRRNINDAVRTGVARTRKSIACIASSKTAAGEDKAKIELAAEMTTKRHRMSLHKAAEITDMAGLGDEDDLQLKETLLTLQKAVMKARGRHRATVATAVKETICGEEEPEAEEEKAKSDSNGDTATGSKEGAPKAAPKFVSKMRACAKVFKTKKQLEIEERIQQAVQAAYKRNGPVKPVEESEVKEEWTTAYEDMSHCYYGYEGYGTGWDPYSGYGYNQMGCNQMGNQMGCNQMNFNQMNYNQMGQMGYNQMACNQMGCGQDSQWQGNQWQGQMGQMGQAAWGQDGYGNYGASSYGNDYNNCYYNNYGQAQNAYSGCGGSWQQAAWGSA